MPKRQPIHPFGRQPPHRSRELAVGYRLDLGAIRADRHGVTARQFQRDDGACVAHHCAAHQLAKALGIGRLARLAGRHVSRAKLLQGPEDAGFEQRQQVVELGEIVLHRRCRQQQHEALVERIHQLIALARAVAQMVRFVHDDEIEAAVENARRMLAATRQGERSDQAILLPEPFRVAAQQRVVGGRAGNVELRFELLLPLPDERRRSQHQDAVDDAAQEILLEYHAGLDGLAEPDLVGKQNAAAILLEHLARGLDLIPEGFDAAQMRQAEQLIEALREAEMGEAFAQAIPDAIAVRRLLQGVQQRREIELGAERKIDLNQRQRRRYGRRNGPFRGRPGLDPASWLSAPGQGPSACSGRSCWARRIRRTGGRATPDAQSLREKLAER